MIINKENYEGYVLDYLEGNLDAKSKVAFESFLLIHPHIRREIEDFEMVSVLPDPSVKHPHIEALLQKPPKRKKRRIVAIWWYAGIAASMALLIYFGGFLFKSGPSDQPDHLVQEDIQLPTSNLTIPSTEKSMDDIAMETTSELVKEKQGTPKKGPEIQTQLLGLPEIPLKLAPEPEKASNISDLARVEDIRRDAAGKEPKITTNRQIETMPLIPSLDLVVVRSPVQIDQIHLLILDMTPNPDETSGLKKWLAKINIAEKIPGKSDLKESLIPEFIAMR